MTRYHATSEGNIPFTPEEEIQADIQEAEYIAQAPERQQQTNKDAATQLLQQTDWTSIPAVADPLRSNPYLTNQGEFDAYRSQLREIAINPPTTPAVFPTQPQEIWSN
jgi:hypothetical protein